jgi:hypothetical protein
MRRTSTACSRAATHATKFGDALPYSERTALRPVLSSASTTANFADLFEPDVFP